MLLVYNKKITLSGEGKVVMTAAARNSKKYIKILTPVKKYQAKFLLSKQEIPVIPSHMSHTLQYSDIRNDLNCALRLLRRFLLYHGSKIAFGYLFHLTSYFQIE